MHCADEELQGRRTESSGRALFPKPTEGKELTVKIVPAETLNLKSQTETRVSGKGEVGLPGRGSPKAELVNFPDQTEHVGLMDERGSGKPTEKMRF